MPRNTININGVTFSSDGSSSVSIVNGRVIVNGRDVTPDSKEIHIAIQGDVANLDVDACEQIAISGSAGSVRTGSGGVECGPVSGDVQSSSGDVRCGNVAGSVQTSSGDVTCPHIGGSVRTSSGDIRR